MESVERLTVIVVDDDAEFGSDLAYELKYLGRRRRITVDATPYNNIDDFIGNLVDGVYDRIDFVLLDEDAEDAGGSRHEGSEISLPKLHQISMIAKNALNGAKLVIYSGKLTPEELNDIRSRSGPNGGGTVWEKSEDTAGDFLDRMVRLKGGAA